MAIRSPCGEYLAATTPWWWWSGPITCLRAAKSQIEAVQLLDAVTSRVESGEKSTALTMLLLSLRVKILPYVCPSHTFTLPSSVPAAIHLPSLETAIDRTSYAAIVPTSLPSATRHTRTALSSPLTRYSPFAENVTTHIGQPPSISTSGRSGPRVSMCSSILSNSLRTCHCRRLATFSASHNVAERRWESATKLWSSCLSLNYMVQFTHARALKYPWARAWVVFSIILYDPVHRVTNLHIDAKSHLRGLLVLIFGCSSPLYVFYCNRCVCSTSSGNPTSLYPRDAAGDARGRGPASRAFPVLPKSFNIRPYRQNSEISLGEIDAPAIAFLLAFAMDVMVPDLASFAMRVLTM